MKKNLSVLITSLILIIIASCASQTRSAYQTYPIRQDIGSVLIPAPLSLKNIFNITSPGELFQKNLTIGQIEFKGASAFDGFYVTSGNLPVNDHTTASVSVHFDAETKGIDILRQQEFGQTATAMIFQLLQNSFCSSGPKTVLSSEQNDIFTAALFPKVDMHVPEKYFRVSGDNANYSAPAIQYSVENLTQEQIDIIKNKFPGQRFVLFSWIESFYTHNRGKFLRRDKKTPPGSRVGILLCLYDIESNQIKYQTYGAGTKCPFSFKLEFPEGEEEYYLQEAAKRAVNSCLLYFCK